MEGLSVEEYDALVDAGKISVWTSEDAYRTSTEIAGARALSNKGRTTGRRKNDAELQRACRKIMAYKLKRPRQWRDE